jgi:hypothetical protein
MIFFFSVEIGPKNSKCNFVFLTLATSASTSWTLELASLSLKTMPFESSYFGDFSPKNPIFVNFQKFRIEMSLRFSSTRSKSTSPRGSKRDLLWIHPQNYQQKKFPQVVKRSDGHGLVPASCQLGPDDSHGVASSRNSSGEFIQTINNFIVYSHSKIVSGLSSDDCSVGTESKLLANQFSANYTKSINGPLVYGVIGVPPCPLDRSKIYIPALTCATLDEHSSHRHTEIELPLEYLYEGNFDISATKNFNFSSLKTRICLVDGAIESCSISPTFYPLELFKIR